MKKPTDKELEAEINQAAKELLANPNIDEESKQFLKDFRKFCKEFPEEIDEISEFVKSGKRKVNNEKHR